MHTLTIQITGSEALKALQELEHQHLIRIMHGSDIGSYSLPGEPISEADFREWVKYAENSPTVSLSDAKLRWAEQRKNLQNLIR